MHHRIYSRMSHEYKPEWERLSHFISQVYCAFTRIRSFCTGILFSELSQKCVYIDCMASSKLEAAERCTDIDEGNTINLLIFCGVLLFARNSNISVVMKLFISA